MSYLLHHPHKAGDFELCRPVVPLRRSEEPGKKENRLDGVSGWPTSFWDGLAGGSVKDNGSKAKLLGDVQVYPEDFLWVVAY